MICAVAQPENYARGSGADGGSDLSCEFCNLLSCYIPQNYLKCNGLYLCRVGLIGDESEAVEPATTTSCYPFNGADSAKNENGDDHNDKSAVLELSEPEPQNA